MQKNTHLADRHVPLPSPPLPLHHGHIQVLEHWLVEASQLIQNAEEQEQEEFDYYLTVPLG